MNQVNIILGSGSPRRKQLLSEMGFSLEVVSLDIDESFPNDISPFKVALHVAQKKMLELRKLKEDNQLLLTADTTVILGDEILGKPNDEKDAIEMLSKLSGNKHVVNTGVVISHRGTTEEISCLTEVFFNELSEQQIRYYVENFKPFDKAGSYGIQDWIGLVAIQKITGSYTNVVGLPTDECYKSIQQLVKSNY